MNNTNSQSTAFKRILRDLAEIEREPLVGLSVCLPDKTDFFTLHANIQIQEGIYKDILLHLIIRIPSDYPNNPPAVNIAPGLKFNHRFHGHMHADDGYGYSICTDLTSNFARYFSTTDSQGKPVKSGWTPAYTLSSVLMQLQLFFADPDLGRLPSETDIQELRKHVKSYQLDVKVNDGDEVKYITHSFQKPYPPLTSTERNALKELKEDNNAGNQGTQDQINKISDAQQAENEEKKTETSEDDDESQDPSIKGPGSIYYESLVKHRGKASQVERETAQKLVCPVEKVTLFDPSKPILGYPVDLKKDNFGRLWPTLIVEILSSEAFESTTKQRFDQLDQFERLSFKSSLGSIYNYWLPIYIDEAHFERKVLREGRKQAQEGSWRSRRIFN